MKGSGLMESLITGLRPSSDLGMSNGRLHTRLTLAEMGYKVEASTSCRTS